MQARISHQDDEPSLGLHPTRGYRGESTKNFPQSEIQLVFHSFRKSFVNTNLCAIISPFGEKYGLAFHYYKFILNKKYLGVITI